MSYAPDDLTPQLALKRLDDLYETLTWVEWWFCGKDDKMADHINADTRDDITTIMKRIEELL